MRVLPKTLYCVLLLPILVAGVPAPAASVAVHQTVLDRPFIWQNGDLDPVTGELKDAQAYRAFDVDSDGRYDVGFWGGYASDTRVILWLNTGVETLNYANDVSLRGGYLVHNDAGALLGAESAVGLYNWWRGSPNLITPEDWNEETWGDVWPLMEGPLLPNDTYAARTPLFAPTNWAGRSGYVGLRILKADGWHYAWIYVEEDGDLPFLGGSVRAYAYETEPDTGIIAGVPEPAALGMLGALGTWMLTRRRRQVSTGSRPV